MTDDAGAAGSSRRTRRRGTALTVAASAALLVGGGTVAAVGLAGRDAALPEPVPTTAAEPSAPDAPPSAPPASPRAAPPPAATAAPSTAPAPAVTPAPAALPVSVTVASVGMSSPLLHLGLQADGALAVPEGDDFDTAAWYDGSPRPGDTGPAVVEGHVSSRARGPSVFFRLSEVAVGDRVEVAREDGTTVAFEVYDVQQHPKDQFPTLAVYGNTDGAELRLITCGGTVAEDDGHFTDNVIVFARAVTA